MHGIESLAAALAVDVVAIAIVHFLGSKYESARQRQLFKRANTFLLSSGIIICLIALGGVATRSWWRHEPLTGPQVLLLCAAIVLPLLFAWVLHVLSSRNPQYEYRKYKIEMKNGRTIETRRIVHSAGLSRVWLSPTTNFDGVEALIKQIRNFDPAISPNLFLGINDGATALAGLVAATLDDAGKIPLGYIDAHGTDHPIIPERCVTPTVDELHLTKTERLEILLFDIEVKRGHALKNAVDWIKQRYRQSDREVIVRIAVLVAAHLKRPISKIEDLCHDKNGAFAYDKDYLPDFLAFTSEASAKLHFDRWNAQGSES